MNAMTPEGTWISSSPYYSPSSYNYRNLSPWASQSIVPPSSPSGIDTPPQFAAPPVGNGAPEPPIYTASTLPAYNEHSAPVVNYVPAYSPVGGGYELYNNEVLLDPKPEQGPSPPKGHGIVMPLTAMLKSIFIVLCLTGFVYLYTLMGGAILSALEDDAAAAAAAAEAADVAAQGFTASQLDFLAGYGIPEQYSGSSDEWNLLNGQFYATTLVTTIGYGNMANKTTGGRWFAVFYSFIGIVVVGSSVIAIGIHMLRIFGTLGFLLLDIFLPIEYGDGQAAVLMKKVDLFNCVQPECLPCSMMFKAWVRGGRTVHKSLRSHAASPLPPLPLAPTSPF